MSPAEVIGLVNTGGVVTVLILGIMAAGFALWRGHIVLGWVYKRELARADRFEAMALELLRLTRRAETAATRRATRGGDDVDG